VNAPILRLFGLVLLLFAALVALTSWNSVINADEYRENPRNQRSLIQEQRIRRGVIRARGGVLLARSVRRGDDEAGLYRRRYSPEARQFAHALGYSFVRIGRAGLERERNDALIGERNALTSVLDELRGERQEGDNVVTTLDPGAQRVALRALQGRKGAVVAIEPQTGKVRVMASTPGYDPNALADARTFSRLSTDRDAPLLNRSTQSGYAPGSTMKVVTAAAALDSGRYTPDSTVSGKSPKVISGVALKNFSDEQFGTISLTTALTNSVNTVWAEVAVKLGRDTMNDYMKRFGFFSDPPLDYPDGQMLPSGVYGERGRLLPVTSRRVDLGRVGIGQERLRVTPLQMAMVAATVANDGVRMKPHLTDRIVDRDGRTVDRIEPEEATRVMSAGNARRLNEMMGHVVEEGTGTAAALQGIQVAGKTGTAELNLQGLNQPWFVGFAPRSDPKVAIAVSVENVQGGTGGAVAAPIAKQVMEQLLR
jgi:peptidoglycan glycosyltransferase